MGVKVVQVSTDDSTYYTLPGGTGDFTIDGSAIDDTIFGQTFKSEQVGTKTWQVTANALYKGFVGYQATIYAPNGASTPLTAASMTQVGSSKTYKVTNAAHDCWDYTQTVNVYDGGVNKNAFLASVDHLQGEITFLSSYTPGGAITADFSYFTLAAVGNPQEYTLTMQCNALQNTDLPTANSNGGWHTNIPGLRTVAMSLHDIFNTTAPFAANITTNTVMIMQINPDGTGESGSLARGIFRVTNVKRSGNVGALELEEVSLALSVPYSNTVTGAPLNPFLWIHGASTPLSTAVQEILNSFTGQTLLYGKYLGDGTHGYKGQGVVTDCSLAGSLTTMNTFNFTLMGSGAPTSLP